VLLQVHYFDVDEMTVGQSGGSNGTSKNLEASKCRQGSLINIPPFTSFDHPVIHPYWTFMDVLVAFRSNFCGPPYSCPSQAIVDSLCSRKGVPKSDSLETNNDVVSTCTDMFSGESTVSVSLQVELEAGHH
jgi:hypothetical protein